jgi:hypothetical protein
MKRLIAMMMCAVSLGAAAQIDWDFPYNPDGNNDGYIFSEDLLDLLAVYGQEFNSEELYLSQDSSSLIVFVGELIAQECLDGNWRVLNWEDLDRHYSDLAMEIEVPDDADYWPYLWVDRSSGLNQPWTDLTLRNRNKLYTTDNDGSSFEIGAFQSQYNANGNFGYAYECWCATKQRPRVEFDRVNALPITEWAEFLNQKASEGWYVLPQPIPASDTQSVTFWRWAE